MMDKEQLIAEYFSNSLSENDQKSFDLLMATDLGFKEDVEFQKRLSHSIHKKEHQNLKQHFSNLEDTIKKEGKSSFKRVWYIAASLLLMVALGFLITRNDSPEKLYAQYYKPATNIVHPIVRSASSETDKNLAFIAYKNQDYKKAHQVFEKLYKQHPESELLFYDAIALLEVDSTSAAIEKLNTHQKFEDAVSSKTNWYLALAYLKINDIQQSTTLLKTIVDTKGYKYEDAQKLLNALD